MLILYKKELNSYLNSAVGYIAIILFAVLSNFLFMKDVFVTGSVSLKSFFSLIPWLYLIFIPALVMRSFAEEKRLNTIEVLLTLPVSETQIVIAKFFAYFTLIFISLVLTLSLPISFVILSHIYLPEILVGYLGALAAASSFIAISLFFSTMTKSQIVSFLLSIFTIFILLGITSELFTSYLPKVVQDALGYFGPIYHFQNFVKGIIDIRSVYFFMSLTVLFIFLTVLRLERRD